MKYLGTKTGEYLRNLRMNKGFSLRQVEIKTGISHSYLSQIENDVKKPSADIIIKLAAVYNEDIINLLKKCECLKEKSDELLVQDKEEETYKIYPKGLKELLEDKNLISSLKISDFEIERLREIKFRTKREISKFDFLDILLTLRRVENVKT